ncbi:dTDP-glucose 4,6-dehydratase [Candidatus Villigracilis affinis]|uniref:dTDP-glucose 4,6-dehydratase n=1 Tax=Candidatus Villigracilis affinis TaxID=3140682 RepID=UPI002A22394E|nr:dTDP-glucose 4,6-dehydratase [Anaerolineales bacterium]
MKNVLVTGGAGFIGSNFVRYILEADPQVQIINLDALTYAGSLENLKDLPNADHHTFVQGDICNRDFVRDLLRQYQIDTIIHFAAETHVDRSILGPEPFIQTNVIGTFTLLEAARQYWQVENALPLDQVRFHHVSTDEVYGTLAPDDPAFSETTPYAPNSPYAASKASSDHLVRSYNHTYQLPVTISNCSNNYGPRQFPEKLIPLVILNALTGKHLPVYGDGQQIRDWLFVTDHCEAIHKIVVDGKPGETYNIGGNNQPANLTIIETICDLLDELQPLAEPHRSLIKFVTDRPGHDRRYAMNISKIERDLGWKPRHSLTDGLLATVQWILANPEWVSAIQKQHEYQTWLSKNYEKRENPS